jgi:hypothetical protein
MKKGRKGPCSTESKPEKVLLHMARTGEGWAGVAIRFSGEEPYRFASLRLLFEWLTDLRRKE